MLIFYYFVFFVFFVFGLWSFVSKRKHMISTLLSLEFLVISLYFYMFFLLSFYFYNMYLLIYFLTFSVCEGALGLSLLVSMIRSHGSDFFGLFNLLQC